MRPDNRRGGWTSDWLPRAIRQRLWGAYAVVVIIALVMAMLDVRGDAWILWGILLQALLAFGMSIRARRAERRRQAYDAKFMWLGTWLAALTACLAFIFWLNRLGL